MPRPKKSGEKANKRKELSLEPSEFQELDEGKPEGAKLATFIKQAALEKVRAASGNDRNNVRFSLPVLADAPGGPFIEAVAEAETTLELSGALASFLDARDDDSHFWVKVRGESMVGAGILDGSLVLFYEIDSLREPRRGQITLIQIERENGQYEGTIKRWMGKKDGRPVLHNGNDEVVPLPEDVVKAIPIAIARGNINAF